MNPKSLFAIGVVVALLSVSAFATAPVSESWSSQWKGAVYSVSARSGEHLRAVSWDPEKQDAPFTVKQAIAVGRTALKKFVSEAHVHFNCSEVRIVDATGRNGPWHYVVRFWSDDPSLVTKVENGIEPAIFSFVVYLDGAVEMPEKTNG